MGNKKRKRQVTGLRGHLKRHFLQRNFLYSKNQFRFSPQALENRHCNIALRNCSVLNECRHIHAPNAMTSEACVCRLILTPHLFVKFLNPARFCSKPSSLFWMSKNHSLPWLFEFGLWMVAMRRWCLRAQLTWRPLHRQRGVCGAGTRLCDEPPATACPAGGTNLPWNTATVCPRTFTLRGTPVLFVRCRSMTLRQVWAVPWKKTPDGVKLEGWHNYRKLNGPGREN